MSTTEALPQAPPKPSVPALQARATRDKATAGHIPPDAVSVLIVLFTIFFAVWMMFAIVPPSYQLHAIGGWLILMVWPFSRLVHAWSVPLGYVRRSPIVYRSRAPRHVRAGAGGLSAVRGARAATSTATEGTPHVHD